MQECIFCKIANNELPSERVLETDKVLVFRDLHPKAATHLLIIPKKHIVSITSEGGEQVAKELIETAKQIAKDHNIKGYKLLFNVGKQGGQMVDHLHLHFLSGKVAELP